jgi:hypothetical protein
MTPSAKSRAFRLAFILGSAFIALSCILLIKPSASTRVSSRIANMADSAASPSSLSSLSDAEVATLLSKEKMGSLQPEEAKLFGAAIVPRAVLEDKAPEEYAACFFPSPSETLAMLARDRDVDDYLENAAEKGPAGAYYQAVADMVPSMKPLRDNYELFFAGVYGALREMGRLKVPAQAYADSTLYKSGVTLPRLSSKPPAREYDYSHTFALDIFLDDIETLPFSTLEKGPVVFSLTDALVIATSASWMGGEDLSTYRSGGITPKAGNGVILYSPAKRKYYLYFHLFDVLVSPGEAIPKGYPLGHGGNTGTNARKPGHGEHLHLEIYDAAASRFLKNYEIADIVF